jgi:hypothetical protein
MEGYLFVDKGDEDGDERSVAQGRTGCRAFANDAG